MRTRLPAALLLVGLLAVTGCGSDSTTTSGSGAGTSTVPTGSGSGTTAVTDGLVGTSWQLVSYQATANVAVPAASEAVAGLVFAEADDLSGSTGCNQFSGTYTSSGSSLTIQLGPMTQAGCASAVLTAQETALAQLLPKVTGYTQTSDSLTLTGADQAVLVTYEPGIAGLTGTSWTVTGVNNGNAAVVSTAAMESLTLVFDTDGSLTGSTGCNQLTGNYSTDGTDQVNLSGGRSTENACSSDAATLETEYLDALEATATYTISGDTLTLRDTTGATQVTLQLAN